MSTCVIFGGSGFVGSHFSQFLLDNNICDQIIVFDLVGLDKTRTTKEYANYVTEGKVRFIEVDVRQKIAFQVKSEISLIANFAAIHREPGHNPVEYYETNLLGAENVCEWAEKVGCKNLIFTSSIAPYGPSEQVRNESSIPVPASAYGGSKLAAEKIHLGWQAKDSSSRKLVIVRPGVVFGAGEGGNVSRLVKATLHKYFFYMGNKQTRKAGTYVKELCNAMWWVLENKTNNGTALFNMSMNPGPTIEDYVLTTCKVAGVKRFVPSVPYVFLLGASFVIDPLARLLGINQPISPIRMRKLVRSNNIIPQFLVDEGYTYKYTLETAMKDWKADKPSEWK